jgi:hypothetical protein
MIYFAVEVVEWKLRDSFLGKEDLNCSHLDSVGEGRKKRKGRSFAGRRQKCVNPWKQNITKRTMLFWGGKKNHQYPWNTVKLSDPTCYLRF